jgi:hypothetical protein
MYQVFCSHEGGTAVYSRTGVETGWSSWGRADGFGYSSLSSLATALGVCVGVGELNNTDANDITDNCIGSFSAGADAAVRQHYPAGYGMIITLVTKGFYNMLQVFCNSIASEIWTRIKESGGSYGNWTKIIG